VDGRINAGQYETLGKNEGSKAVMRRMLSLFNHLQDEWHHGLPKGTFLYVWRFSNSGTSPECMVKEIPDRAIEFLWKASQSNLCTELESLVGLEGKNPHYSLFNCILKKRDYPSLYPKGRKPGASPKLFSIYQTSICNHSTKALEAAFKIAKEIAANKSSKELKRLQRPEAFKDRGMRIQANAEVVKLVEKGELTLEE